jgi:hypothetical protein
MHPLSFAKLDLVKGYRPLPPPTENEYPLPAWYREVYETPLDELTVFDVCRACQQRIHLEHIVPLAFRLLSIEPLAGERYDGELIASLIGFPREYWPAHLADLAEVCRVCRELLAGPADDLHQKLRSDFAAFLRDHLPSA